MQTQKKKIAFVYDAIFPYVTGGAEKRFFEVGKRLAAKGHDVHIYGMKSWDGPDTIAESGMTLHGIMKKESLYTAEGKRSIGETLRFGLAVWRLRKESFDVIDCCSFPYFPLFSLRLITWIKRKPLYCTWHEVWGREYWREYLGKAGVFGYMVELAASGMPDTVISVSDSTTEALETGLGRKNKVITIPNGVDLEKIAEIKAGEESSDIIFVGRLLAYKNVDKLIEALTIVKKQFPNITLTIIGKGPEEENLKQLVSESGLKANVRFVGFVEENKLFSYMKASKMLALPSSREGFGMVALEAKACGLPVLTVDEPQNAARRLVTNGIDGVITKADSSGIAKGILDLLENHGVAAAAKRDIERYDWRNITAEIEKVFNFQKE